MAAVLPTASDAQAMGSSMGVPVESAIRGSISQQDPNAPPPPSPPPHYPAADNSGGDGGEWTNPFGDLLDAGKDALRALNDALDSSTNALTDTDELDASTNAVAVTGPGAGPVCPGLARRRCQNVDGCTWIRSTAADAGGAGRPKASSGRCASATDHVRDRRAVANFGWRHPNPTTPDSKHCCNRGPIDPALGMGSTTCLCW